VRVLGVTAGLWMVAGCTWAAGYDDFMRGAEAMHAGNFDLAITAYTNALNDRDLASTYLPEAYVGRAAAYLRKQQCASALTDLDAALKLKPDLLAAHLLRAGAEQCLDKQDAARADFDAAVTISPTAEIYRSRGDYRWYHGDFAGAAQDYAQGFKLAPKNGYLLLWSAVAAGRAGTFDAGAFAKQVSDIDLDDWPGPLLDFYAGKAKEEDAYRKAARGDGDTPKNQKCEADFYLAEWRINSKVAGAKPLLEQAVQECPHNFVEYGAAREELKRLP
jgi:lipoprotein NlpI